MSKTVAEQDAIVALCRQIAIEAHAGMKRWGGEDYFDAHVAIIAERARERSRHHACVAYLHDVVEECAERGYTIEALRERGVPRKVLVDVETLTHRQGERYAAYIERIANGSDAAFDVKILDLEHNLSTLPEKGNAQRRDKYELAMAYLKLSWEFANYEG